MGKALFLIGFTIIHAALGCAALVVAFLTVFNMCGPAHPANWVTYIAGGIGCILMCPFALPAHFVADWLGEPGLVPWAMLFNSYAWGAALWRWRAGVMS